MKDIIDRCFKKIQKGQILVLTALLLPMFLAASGLAIDFGNLYVHKAKLQNAADAAAYVAGWKYVKPYDDKTDVESANFAAATSVAANEKNASISLSISSDKKYIAATVSEQVPVYFLTYFGVDGITNVSATGYAEIEKGSSTPDSTVLWDKLFYFGGNSLEMSDGVILKKDSTSWTVKQNFTWRDIVKLFFDILFGRSTGMPTSIANLLVRNYNTSISYDSFGDNILGENTWDNYLNAKAMLQTLAEKSLDGNTKIITQSTVGTTAKENDTLYEYLKLASGVSGNAQSDWRIFNEFSKEIQYYFENLADVGTEGFKKYAIDYNNQKNGDRDTSRFYSQLNSEQDKSKPYYFVLDPDNKSRDNILEIGSTYKSADAFNLNPIVIVYTGTGTLNVQIKATTKFKGIIYAPNANVSVTDESSKGDATFQFKGSIVAKSINLELGTYEPYSITTGGGSGGGVTNVQLISGLNVDSNTVFNNL